MVDDQAEDIPGRLKRYREAKGLSQSDVTEKLGLGKVSLSGYERGVNIPSEDVLIRLGELYGVHPAILRYGDGVWGDALIAEAADSIDRVGRELVALASALRRGALARATASTPPVSTGELDAIVTEQEKPDASSKRRRKGGDG